MRGHCREGERCAYAHARRHQRRPGHQPRSERREHESKGGDEEEEADLMSCSSSGEEDEVNANEASMDIEGAESTHQVVPYQQPEGIARLVSFVHRRRGPGPARLVLIPAFERRREQLESSGASVRRVRVVCLSDTHMKHRMLTPFMPQGDDHILIHAGDFTCLGLVEHALDFNEWLGTLHYRHKFVVSGNHERVCGDVREHDAYAELITNANYIINQEVKLEEFGGLTLFLSSWERKYRDGTSAESELFPWDHPSLNGQDNEPSHQVDVLVTHMPPRGILDCVRLVKHRGSITLRARMERMKPIVHLFGHAHGGGVEVREPTTFINAANPGVAGPIVFDYYY